MHKICLLPLWKSERRTNNCYVVFGDKNEVFPFFKEDLNIKHVWLLHRILMLHSRNPKITGGSQSGRVKFWL